MAIDGTNVVFTPGANFTGGSFTYTIIDGHGGSATGTVTINDINTAPDDRAEFDRSAECA